MLIFRKKGYKALKLSLKCLFLVLFLKGCDKNSYDIKYNEYGKTEYIIESSKNGDILSKREFMYYVEDGQIKSIISMNSKNEFEYMQCYTANKTQLFSRNKVKEHENYIYVDRFEAQASIFNDGKDFIFAKFDKDKKFIEATIKNFSDFDESSGSLEKKPEEDTEKNKKKYFTFNKVKLDTSNSDVPRMEFLKDQQSILTIDYQLATDKEIKAIDGYFYVRATVKTSSKKAVLVSYFHRYDDKYKTSKLSDILPFANVKAPVIATIINMENDLTKMDRIDELEEKRIEFDYSEHGKIKIDLKDFKSTVVLSLVLDIAVMNSNVFNGLAEEFKMPFLLDNSVFLKTLQTAKV